MDMYDDFINDRHREWFSALMIAASTVFFGLGWLFLDFAFSTGNDVARILAYIVAAFLDLNGLAVLAVGLWQGIKAFK